MSRSSNAAQDSTAVSGLHLTMEQTHKAHQKRHSGVKAERKKDRKAEKDGKGPVRHKGENWKAFAVGRVGKATRRLQHHMDKTAKKHHMPTVDRRPDIPPPVMVAVVGPPQVGKTTLIRSLVNRYTRQVGADWVLTGC